MTELHIAQDPVADKVLSEHSFALLCGMLLDQQFPMERAFAGPAKILERFGSLDPVAIADADPDEFAALCIKPPAIHRFPGSMAARVQAMAATIATTYGGDTARLWNEAASGRELLARINDLPGFGAQKSRIFVALLGKQLGVRPPGWQAAAGGYAEEGIFTSVADVTGPDSLAKVRAYKKDKKDKLAAGGESAG
jgi:uncharacterized HhH-GPD family protein